MFKKTVFSLCVGFALAACDTPPATNAAAPATTSDEYVRTTDAATFAQTVVGKRLETVGKPGRWFRLNADGSMSGDIGKGAIAGQWTFEGGYWCRTFTAGVSIREPDCQLVELKSGVVRLTRNRGQGGAGEFNIQ